MAGTVMPAPKFIGLDNNANPVSGGKLYTYVAGTTTPQATYSDVNLTVANANPVVLDSAGRATVFLSGSSYKFVLKDSDDVTIWTQDNVQAVAPFSTNLDIQGVAGEAILAGQACYLSDGSGALTAGRWYLADADNAYSSSLPQIAIAPDAIDTGETGTFRLQGSVTKANAQSDFVVGSTYYIAGTAGLLSLTPGTNQRIMGQADSTTTIVISPNPPNVAVTPTFVNSVTVTSTDGGATAGPVLDLYRDSASPAASDQIGEVRFSGEDSAGNKQLYARIYGQIADATSTTEDGQVRVAVVSNGTETLMLVLTESGAVLPDLTTQDLGSGAKPWRNVFLSGTGKLDFGNGDVTVTASSNTLTFAGASSGYVFDDHLKFTVGKYLDWGTTVGSFGGRFGRYITGSFLIGIPGTSASEAFLVTDSAGSTVAEFRGNKTVLNAATVSVGGATPATTGAGITFPASQSASSDANTLDDYEEGDWTPGDASGQGLVFTQAVGKYTKIGRVVYVSGYVVYPVTANANTAGISGLPFSVANNDAAPASSVLSYSTETTARYWLLTKNSTSGVFYNSAGAGITNATLSGDTVYFGGSYLVS